MLVDVVVERSNEYSNIENDFINNSETTIKTVN